MKFKRVVKKIVTEVREIEVEVESDTLDDEVINSLAEDTAITAGVWEVKSESESIEVELPVVEGEMKEVEVFFKGSWSTCLMVPIDFVYSESNVLALVKKEWRDFDFEDGGADWKLSSSFLIGEEDDNDATLTF